MKVASFVGRCFSGFGGMRSFLIGEDRPSHDRIEMKIQTVLGWWLFLGGMKSFFQGGKLREMRKTFHREINNANIAQKNSIQM